MQALTIKLNVRACDISHNLHISDKVIGIYSSTLIVISYCLDYQLSTDCMKINFIFSQSVEKVTGKSYQEIKR